MKEFILLLALCTAFSGCYRKEWDAAKTESDALKVKVAALDAENNQLKESGKALQAENTRLKETAQFHFQTGLDYLAAKNFDAAASSFQTVIYKFPYDPLVVPAKKNIIRVGKEKAREMIRKVREEAAMREAAAEQIRNRFATIYKQRMGWADSGCEGKGYPGYAYWFKGDTFARRGELAATLGCRYDAPIGISDTTMFCCSPSLDE